jgi:hypothetical protein
MGNVVSNLCDCSHKDPRTEINMFLTQNQTIQFSSSIENIKMQRKEPLTTRTCSSTKTSSKYKIKDNLRNDTSRNVIKSRNGKNNLFYNKSAIFTTDYNNNKKEYITTRNKSKKNLQLKDINLHSFIYPNINSKDNTTTTKSFNSNYSYCSNKITPAQINELIKAKGNSEIYIGEKKGKIKCGLGLLILNNDTFFFGNYKDNKINGFGKFVSGKTVYKGEFKNDESNGYGNYSSNKMEYEGYWSHDLQNNFGIEKWKDGSEYRGQYYNGKKNGIGTYRWADGNKYEGEFKNNSYHGYGIFYYLNDQYYAGQWVNNEKCGYGEYITKDKIFFGYYSNDKRNGIGLTFLKNKNKYMLGFWKNGNKTGPAKIVSKNKITYLLYDIMGNSTQINNYDEFNKILNEKGLIRYKECFDLSLNEICKIINNFFFSDYLLKK